MAELLRHLPPDQAQGYAVRMVDVILDKLQRNRRPQMADVGVAIPLLGILPRDRVDNVVERLVQWMVTQTKPGAIHFDDDVGVCLGLNMWLRPEQRVLMRDWILKQAPQAPVRAVNGSQEESAVAVFGVCRLLSAEQAEGLLRERLDRFTDPQARTILTDGIARIGGPPVDQAVVVEQVTRLADTKFPLWDIDTLAITSDLEALCCGLTREELHRRKALPSLTGGLMSPESLPKPNPLPPQALVDLLKRPFVLWEKRRAVLNALEFTYDRRFKDLWEFVAFAEKEHPELDLLTPPKRPTK